MYYDSISRGYEELYGAEQRRKLALVKKHLHVYADDRLLDVGCGTGISSDFPCKVVGLDPSAELLKQSDKETVRGMAEDLPFPDKSFDFVVSLTAAQNFTDPAKAIDEMARVCRRLCVVSFLKRSPKRELLMQNLARRFRVTHKLEEEKDLIFIMEPL